ncbi:hypothetical protein JCM10212_001610 [Sporobolomyces blumeae]
MADPRPHAPPIFRSPPPLSPPALASSLASARDRTQQSDDPTASTSVHSPSNTKRKKRSQSQVLHHVDSIGLRGEEDDHYHHDLAHDDHDRNLNLETHHEREPDERDDNRGRSSPGTASGLTLRDEARDERSAEARPGSRGSGDRDRDVEKGIRNKEYEGGRAVSRTKTERVPDEDRKWKDNIVGWSSPDDPENPKNWSFGRRYLITFILGMTTMSSTFASSIFSSAIPYVSQEFGISNEVATLGTSLFLAGYVVGPSVWAPSSEVFGRKIVFGPMVVFICFSAATATSKDVQSIMITRFFAGVFASAPVTTVGGGLADMFDQRERATAVVYYALAVVAGPTISPLIGASVSQSYLGWRWTEYLVVILASAVTLVGFLFVPETFAPVLLTRKANRLRRKTGRWELHSKHEENDFSIKIFVEKTLTRPITMLAREPMVLCVCMYNSFTYGVLYLLFGAVPIIFVDNKGWTPVQAALPFLAVLVGCLTAAAINLFYSVRVFAPYVDRHEGRARPEMRLPTMAIGSVLFPGGFFLLGWADTAGQIVGLWMIGTSFLLIFQSGINYLIDAYTVYSASAVAANTLLRSVFASALPLVTMPLFDNLGVGRACSLLGGLAAGLGTVPFLFYVYGPKLRSMSKMAKSD